MGTATRLIATYFSHFCALVIGVNLLGALRLIRSVRSQFGPARLSQILSLAWLVLLLVATYLVPGVGTWAVGFVVPLFADSHFHAWIAELLGPEALMRNTVEVLRKVGLMKYVAMASIPPLLFASIGLALVVLSGGRNTWERALGIGVLMSAPMAVLNHLLMARRLMRERGAA